MELSGGIGHVGDWRPSPAAQRFFWHFGGKSSRLFLKATFFVQRAPTKMDQCHVETRGNDVFSRKECVFQNAREIATNL